MKPGAWRLAAAALLFVAWLGYLLTLALTTARPIVLSRPQFLVSRLDVIAEVPPRDDGRPDDRITVLEVCWPPGKEGLVNQTIRVTNLSTASPDEGWTGAGRYILPLVPDGPNYEVAAIPPSPGFDPRGRADIRIYPETPQTRAQLRQVPKAEE